MGRKEKTKREEREKPKLLKRRARNIIEPLQNPNLPDHVILDHILPNLPVKSLIRFKSVCKNWCSFISSPQFQKTHLQISSSRHYFLLVNHFLLIDSTLRSNFLLPYDEHGMKDFVKLNDEFLNTSGCYVTLVGSCNGLVCLSFSDVEKILYFLVWNPATHEYRKINKPNRCQRYPFFVGFGYASLLEDYKIICAYDDDQELDVYVFLLRADNWKPIGSLRDYGIVFELEDSFEIKNEGMLFDDTLYWCLRTPKYACILGFELISEQFKEITRMNLDCEYDWIKVHVINKRLALQRIGYDDSSNVWIPKEHDNYDSWNKAFVVPSSIHLVGFSSEGKCLMQERKGSKFMLVDLPREALEDAQVTSFSNNPFESMHYVESLISPWNNTGRQG